MTNTNFIKNSLNKSKATWTVTSNEMGKVDSRVKILLQQVKLMGFLTKFPTKLIKIL